MLAQQQQTIDQYERVMKRVSILFFVHFYMIIICKYYYNYYYYYAYCVYY